MYQFNFAFYFIFITLVDAFRITCQHRNKMNDMSITMMIDSPFSETITSFNTFELSYGFTKPWWEDDLPNILGINPLEAAVIFGALYFFYGPDTLYDFAREAGKLFSTYAPVLQNAASDVFNEFKDYLEEDRERKELKDQGIVLEWMDTGAACRTFNVLTVEERPVAAALIAVK